MNFLNIAVFILLLVWVALLGWQTYELGYEDGERAGREEGCRCRRSEGECPCEEKEGE